jgi:2-hydroxychromene-2-carboxylate isomerase
MCGESARASEETDMPSETVMLYTDYKSPYAYLAKDPAYRLEREFDIRLDWRPYTLDIPAAFGTVEGRTEHDRLRAEAESLGVFGVPTFVIDGELFWGHDRIESVCERLAERGLRRRGPKRDGENSNGRRRE